MKPQVFFGKVMHARLFPRPNKFTYGIYYIYLPLSFLAGLKSSFWLGINKFRILSFYARDHGNLTTDIREILGANGLSQADGEIVLISMPRVLGYVFNPISFWLCHDRNGGLRAVLCEVNNTFGENHNYLCCHDDYRIITSEDIFEARKLFHVSPFMQRTGSYSFRFHTDGARFSAWIDYFDELGQKKLVTSLAGKLEDLNDRTLRKAFFAYPLVTLKTIYLIHYQALRLLTKGIRYVPKPEQSNNRLSISTKITKS